MITTALLLLILVSVCVGFYQVFKRQGRMLLRLDELELKAPAAQRNSGASVDETELGGLPLQSDFPVFSFPDLSGRSVALGDFRGRRVLLVNWNFECGFCDSIAPHLVRLEPSLKRRNVQLLLLVRGEARANQEGAAEHGLKCPILLMTEREEGGPFDEEGTPVAYLLDEAGRVASPVARGADRVLALAWELAGQHAERQEGVRSEQPRESLAAGPALDEKPQPHRLHLPQFLVKHELGLGDLIKRVTTALGIKPCVGCERRAAALNRWLVVSGISGKGLEAGTAAPAFSLPDLEGRMVSLQEYRGRRLFLMFTDPQCGSCDELAPHLVRTYREHVHNGMGLLLVARGNVEENRRKAEKHGYQFPVLLQDRNWKVSNEYGILATPAAFLIGENGVITRDAAVGRDAVLALIRDGGSSRKEE